MAVLIPPDSSPAIPAGSDSARIDARQKRLINCHQVDVNQLVPLRYRWAWEHYLKMGNYEEETVKAFGFPRAEKK